MQFITRVAHAEAVQADCVVVGVYDGDGLTAAAQRVDRACKGVLSAAIKSGDISGKAANVVMLRSLNGVTATRLMVIGLGKKDDFKIKIYLNVVRAAVKHAGAPIKELVLAAEDWGNEIDVRLRARLLVSAARESVFRSDELKSKKDDSAVSIKKVTLLLAGRSAAAERGLTEGIALADGMELTKRLGNLPGNICTPTFLAEQARELGREFKLDVEIFDRRGIEKLKMGSFLSVAKGSAQEPRLIVLKYNGGAKSGKGSAPVALVGKGITFDSGGISLKPGAAMDEMKFDMCGAATVLGTLRTAAQLKLKINLVGVVVSCENMPSGTANKPGDIVTSLSGQTVEILNTDAEGRLILNDALTFVSRFKPATVIDIATLTGACVVALGGVNSGLFSEDEELAAALLKAGRAVNDPAWRLPLDDDYQDQLKSNFADMANIGLPGQAGAIVAACFLKRYVKGYAWAHLDIAGTAWKGGAAKGASGRPVPLLTEYLIERAGA